MRIVFVNFSSITVLDLDRHANYDSVLSHFNDFPILIKDYVSQNRRAVEE